MEGPRKRGGAVDRTFDMDVGWLPVRGGAWKVGVSVLQGD